MRYPPVHWYEGLFLQPHHFQAADRNLAELMQSSLEFHHPYYYGIRSLEYGPEALANHQFEVRSLRARMRDGTIIDLDPGQQLDRLDLKRLRDPDQGSHLPGCADRPVGDGERGDR